MDIILVGPALSRSPNLLCTTQIVLVPALSEPRNCRNFSVGLAHRARFLLRRRTTIPIQDCGFLRMISHGSGLVAWHVTSRNLIRTWAPFAQSTDFSSEAL